MASCWQARRVLDLCHWQVGSQIASIHFCCARQDCAAFKCCLPSRLHISVSHRRRGAHTVHRRGRRGKVGAPACFPFPFPFLPWSLPFSLVQSSIDRSSPCVRSTLCLLRYVIVTSTRCFGPFFCVSLLVQSAACSVDFCSTCVLPALNLIWFGCHSFFLEGRGTYVQWRC
jgi:hypothetical protein